MAGSDDETAVPQTPPAHAPAGELPPGTLLNGIYRIEARLGVGGMGEVYRATNLANDEIDAIKIIGRGHADQTLIEAMFRKEARVLSRIRSPAVAQLKLFLRDPALNLLYFITDFVPGESLLDRLKRQPATPDELRTLMRRVLTGLRAAHEAGVVHRDLSPDNIILPDGDPARATIIDFGIAKELDPARTTMIGDAFAGKLGYIAPEQLGFSGSRIGPWIDLYSLALVGVAFAAGKPLDMGATVGRAEEARRGPIDLSAVPADLRPLFGRLLTYDWQARPESTQEVIALLDGAPPTRLTAFADRAAVVSGPSQQAAGQIPQSGSPAGSARGRWLIAALLVIGSLVVAGLLSMRRSAPDRVARAAPATVAVARPLASPGPIANGATVRPSSSSPATPCGPVIHIAFPRNESTSIGSEPLISGALDRVAMCRPGIVTVTGKANSVEEAPAELARRRADKIAEALRKAGVPSRLVRIRAVVGTPSRTDIFQNEVVEIAFDR